MMKRKLAVFTVLALTGFALAAHPVTPAKAAKIALAKVHGKLMGTPKLEHEDGVWQYEVLVRVGKAMKEINVNADSGKIGSVETTTPGEEARESKAERKGKKEKGD